MKRPREKWYSCKNGIRAKYTSGGQQLCSVHIKSVISSLYVHLFCHYISLSLLIPHSRENDRWCVVCVCTNYDALFSRQKGADRIEIFNCQLSLSLLIPPSLFSLFPAKMDRRRLSLSLSLSLPLWTAAAVKCSIGRGRDLSRQMDVNSFLSLSRFGSLLLLLLLKCSTVKILWAAADHRAGGGGRGGCGGGGGGWLTGGRGGILNY